MRKIISKYAKKKKDRSKQLIIAIGLVVIMFFSVLGYSFSGRGGEDKKISYNGFEFVNQDDFWILNMGDLNFIFKYNPYQVENMSGKLKYLNNYYNKPLYIFSESNEAELEIYNNLDQIILRRQYACLEEECNENWPVKTCADNFIIIKENNISKIVQEENCVFIQGPPENLTKLTDEFLFKILGIKE